MNPESDIRNDYDVKFQLKEEEIFRDQVTFTVECRGIKYGIMSIKMHPSDFEILPSLPPHHLLLMMMMMTTIMILSL